MASAGGRKKLPDFAKLRRVNPVSVADGTRARKQRALGVAFAGSEDAVRKGLVSTEIAAGCREVFDLLHDYSRRLEWDTLLRRAELCDGARAPGVGVRSLCVGRLGLGGIPMLTEYVSFQRGKIAAVKLVGSPPFFRTFAATIRHRSLDQHRSEIVYIYHFRAKPNALAWLIEPVMNRLLRRETEKRLAALKRFVEDPAFFRTTSRPRWHAGL